VAAGVGLKLAIPQPPVIATIDRPGAGALVASPGTAVAQATADSITPDPLLARDDLPDPYARGCPSDYAESVPVECEFGDPAAKIWVVLVGDSRAAQWSPAVQLVAAQEHWRLTTITKAGCPYAHVKIVKATKTTPLTYASCLDWNAATTTLLTAGPRRPDLVVTTAFAPYLTTTGNGTLKGPKSQQLMVKGLHQTWATLNAAQIPVVAIRETPLMATDVAECVSEHRTSLNRCTTPREEALRLANAIQPAAAGLPGSAAIDLTPWICPAATCPVVIGNVLIYRDEHHLTATFARSLAPFLRQTLDGLRTSHFDNGVLDHILTQR